MALSYQQISTLLEMVVSTHPDSLDCDGCFAQLAEFTEHRLAGRDLSEALRAVEIHLQQCPCCRDEYETLMTGLRALDS